jgi:hypothetical protein
LVELFASVHFVTSSRSAVELLAEADCGISDRTCR